MKNNDLKTRDTRFAEFLEHRDELLPLIKEYSPIELVTKEAPPIFMSYTAEPALGQEQKNPTQLSKNAVR